MPTVYITGGATGIGAATVRKFATHGFDVAVFDINGEDVAKISAEIDTGSVHFFATDVRNRQAVRTSIAAAGEKLGAPDALFVNAGVQKLQGIFEMEDADIDLIIDVNLKGTYFCCRAAMPALRESGGNIVNIASTEGLMGLKGASIYCASKGGVVLLTRALSAELAPDVRINCVCPGYIDTDMVRRDWIDKTDDPATTLRDEVDAFAPMNRIGRPAEVAAAILYLASDQAGFTTGAALAVDGGATATN